MALTQSVIFPLQAIAGGAFVALFGLFGIKLFPTFGFLAPLGFEEGPGQALSIGKVWQGFGFEHATTIGLTFAAMGFFFSFFVGANEEVSVVVSFFYHPEHVGSVQCFDIEAPALEGLT